MSNPATDKEERYYEETDKALHYQKISLKLSHLLYTIKDQNEFLVNLFGFTSCLEKLMKLFEDYRLTISITDSHTFTLFNSFLEELNEIQGQFKSQNEWVKTTMIKIRDYSGHTEMKWEDYIEIVSTVMAADCSILDVLLNKFAETSKFILDQIDPNLTHTVSKFQKYHDYFFKLINPDLF